MLRTSPAYTLSESIGRLEYIVNSNNSLSNNKKLNPMKQIDF